MSELLLKVRADGLRSLELIPKELEIYDDKIVYKDRGLLSRKESTISYRQVSQVSMNKGLLHTTLTVVNTGGCVNIVLEHLSNDLANKAKELIEKYVKQAHSFVAQADNPRLGLTERMVQLKELLDQGLIKPGEYEEKRKAIIASV